MIVPSLALPKLLHIYSFIFRPPWAPGGRTTSQTGIWKMVLPPAPPEFQLLAHLSYNPAEENLLREPRALRSAEAGPETA